MEPIPHHLDQGAPLTARAGLTAERPLRRPRPSRRPLPRRSALPALPALIVGLLLAVVLASPAAAYTIYLKNGSTLIAKGKYEVQNGKAIITLLSGTTTSLDLKQIDVNKTEAMNRLGNYGSAVVLDTGASPQANATAPPTLAGDTRITDVVGGRTPSAFERAEARRAGAAGNGPVTGRSGFLDLSTLPQKPYAAQEVAAEIKQFFNAQELPGVEVFAGTRPDRPLVVVVAGSEATVFKALGTAANALLSVRDHFSRRQGVAAIELLLQTPNHQRAGQFTLDPQMAADLSARRVEPAAFFVENVQF